MLRGSEVTVEEPGLDGNADHVCGSDGSRDAREQIRQAVKMWHSLNSVYRFCLNADHYQMIWGNNHGRSRQVRSEELPQTLTGKEVTVAEGEVVRDCTCGGRGQALFRGDIPPSAAWRQVHG